MRKRLRSRVEMRLPTPARAVPPPPSANRLPPTAFAPLSANSFRSVVRQPPSCEVFGLFSASKRITTCGYAINEGKTRLFFVALLAFADIGGTEANRAPRPTGHRGQPGVAEGVIAHRLARRTESPAGRIRRPRPRCGSLSGDLCRARVDFLHNGNSGSVRITLS